jgi:hypothetical protein
MAGDIPVIPGFCGELVSLVLRVDFKGPGGGGGLEHGLCL